MCFYFVVHHFTSIMNLQKERNPPQITNDCIHALAHPLRLKILHFINQQEKVNVNKIYNAMKLDQSIVSQHLKVLRFRGYVITVREERFIYYSLNYKRLARHINVVKNFIAAYKFPDSNTDWD